jgi:hypothetical protein
MTPKYSFILLNMCWYISSQFLPEGKILCPFIQFFG